MRRFEYVLTYLDKGRFERSVEGTVIASNLPSAFGKAARAAKKETRNMRMIEGTYASIRIIIGPRTNGQKEDG